MSAVAANLERARRNERAAMLRDLTTKRHATMRSESRAHLESELDTLVHAVGLALRPGARQRHDAGILAFLREAIMTSRVVEFRCLAQSTGRRSRQCVEPCGLLYGNCTFVVGRTDWSVKPRLCCLANMSEARLAGEMFVRDPEFDLQRYARRFFGIFQETPVKVVLQFDPAVARDAPDFIRTSPSRRMPTGH